MSFSYQKCPFFQLSHSCCSHGGSGEAVVETSRVVRDRNGLLLPQGSLFRETPWREQEGLREQADAVLPPTGPGASLSASVGPQASLSLSVPTS